MAVTINSAYPWGRSFEEYRRMFGLSDADLTRRILGCADGPASFNAVMHRLGRRVISCDPLYQFGRDEIRARIDVVCPQFVEAATKNRDRFIWEHIRSPEELGRVRMQAMQAFLDDYEAGRRRGRYLTGALPRLPFADGAFELALCSHFLFLYSEELGFDFHWASLLELCRVAAEVRIFPLLDMKGRPSQHLAPILALTSRLGLRATVDRVPYEFQRGGNDMLKITARRDSSL